MKTIEIKGTVRESVGKKNSKKLRREGQIPCVIYGGEQNIHFSTGVNEVRHLIYTPDVFLVNLTIEDKTHMVIMKDAQFHPVSDAILHIDFIEVSEDKKIEIAIPVVLTGFAEGVKQGGKLSLLNRRLRVSAYAKDLPETLEVDITNLTLGKSVKIGELSFDNLELLDPKNSVVASVKLTRAARGLAAEGEEGEEGEEGAETATEE